jgi:hypothetical protein
MKETVVQIKGANWTVKKLTTRKFVKLHGDKECPALTVPCDREIHLNGDLHTTKYFRHELLHAFASECNTESMTSMTIDDMEELCASIVGEYAIELVKMADELQAFFSK